MRLNKVDLLVKLNALTAFKDPIFDKEDYGFCEAIQQVVTYVTKLDDTLLSEAIYRDEVGKLTSENQDLRAAKLKYKLDLQKLIDQNIKNGSYRIVTD